MEKKEKSVGNKPKYLYGFPKSIFNKIDNELYEPKINFSSYKHWDKKYYFGISNKHFNIDSSGYLGVYIKEEDIIDFGYGIKILRPYDKSSK